MERKVQIKKAEQERGLKRSRSRSLDDEEVKGDSRSNKDFDIIDSDQLPANLKIIVIKQGKVRKN
jgi:hypothetical protein